MSNITKGSPDSNSFDVTVTITTAPISVDTIQRSSVTLLADQNNTDIIKIGGSSPTFPLAPGAAVEKNNTRLSLIYAVAVSGSQVLHVDCGGSVV